MKSVFFSLLFFSCSTAVAQMHIGTGTPNESAALDIKSNDKALLIPRLTASAIAGIASPQEGMLVYNVDSNRFWGYGDMGTSSNAIVQPSGGAYRMHSSVPSTGGQSFIPTSSFRLNAVTVSVKISGPVGSTATLRCSIGELPGPTLSTSSSIVVPRNTATYDTSITFLFSSAPQVLANSQYRFAVTAVAMSPNTEWWLSHTGNVYSGGVYLDGGGVQISSYDAKFILRRANFGWKPLDN